MLKITWTLEVVERLSTDIRAVVMDQALEDLCNLILELVEGAVALGQALLVAV